MKKLLTVLLLCSAITLIGAGCSKKADVTASEADAASPSLTDIPRSALHAPDDVRGEFERASAISTTKRGVYVNSDGKNMTLQVPAGWGGDGPVWRPSDDDKINHIRASYFPNDGAKIAWEDQQGLEVHDVVSAEDLGGRYLLIVNHPTLKATILKYFIDDPAFSGQSHYFLECRIGYDADRAAFWDACKTALDSVEVVGVGQ